MSIGLYCCSATCSSDWSRLGSKREGGGGRKAGNSRGGGHGVSCRFVPCTKKKNERAARKGTEPCPDRERDRVALMVSDRPPPSSTLELRHVCAALTVRPHSCVFTSSIKCTGTQGAGRGHTHLLLVLSHLTIDHASPLEMEHRSNFGGWGPLPASTILNTWTGIFFHHPPPRNRRHIGTCHIGIFSSIKYSGLIDSIFHV